MREAASFIANQGSAAPAGLLSVALSAAQDAIRTWNRRRSLANLQDFDDHQLADIGVSREDVSWALAQPFLRDPTTALQERALRHRSHGWRG